MKNLDGLMQEDRENTLAMLTILYISKMKTVKMYAHSLMIFVILSLTLFLVCEDVKHNAVVHVAFAIFVIVGIYINYSAQKAAKNLKELIDTYTIK